MTETINAGNQIRGISVATEKRDIFSYDYITIDTNDKFALEYFDCYQALGWELIKSEQGIALKTVLSFKRDRKIKNKDQLNKIQLKLDETMAEISKFEFQKTKVPFIAAMGVGSVGVLAFGGGMSLCILNSAIGAIIGGVALGIVGLGICGLGYLAYAKLNAKKSKEMNVLIDKKRDEISLLCEQAQALLG